MIYQRPEKIFKYVSAEICETIIKNQTIKFSNPEDFNDAFDCDVERFSFKTPDTLNEHTIKEIQLLKQEFGHISEFNELIAEDGIWERMYKHAQIEKIKSARVSCFSLLHDNDAMWGLYANKHHGVCLEFDGALGESGFKNLNTSDVSEGLVGYDDDYNINYLQADRSYAVYKLFMCKKPVWSYEKEFRILTLGVKPEIQLFDTKFLTGIYFGIRSDIESIQVTKDLCQLNGFMSTKFYETKKVGSHLEFEEN